jgi:queuine/archaeosine tRNA-ribosyltransferase
VSRNVHDVVGRVARDQSYAKNARVLPIVHIPTRKGQFHTSVAPDLFCGIAEAIRPDIIAVPERELGSGIVEKARVVSEIRKRLNQLGRYQAIHLLGTGNPLSLAVLSAAGADTFDGLEWCRTVADHETGLLYHFQQYDFFKQQTRSSASAIAKNAVDRPEVSYSAKVAFHNLEFLRVWMMELQKDTEHERVDRLLRGFLPKGFFRELAEALPDVFPQ